MIINLTKVCSYSSYTCVIDKKCLKNFEKRSRKHFFKGVIRFWKMFKCSKLYSWVLTCVTFAIWKITVERTRHLLDFCSVTLGICHMAFAFSFEWNNVQLSGIVHRVYVSYGANNIPFIFVHFRGVFPYINQ